MTSPSVRRSSTRAEEEPVTLKEKACRPVCRRRQRVAICHEQGHEIQRQHSDSEQTRTLLERQRERILFENSSSRPTMTEEVYKNRTKRSTRSKKNFIVLKQTNDVDKIINFFMNSYWSKTGIFAKLTRKVLMKWKN